jgi:hypothetical protein
MIILFHYINSFKLIYILFLLYLRFTENFDYKSKTINFILFVYLLTKPN